jgi:hypothetical protein
MLVELISTLDVEAWFFDGYRYVFSSVFRTIKRQQWSVSGHSARIGEIGLWITVNFLVFSLMLLALTLQRRFQLSVL